MNVVGFGTVAMDVLMQTAELPAEDGFAVIEKSEYLPGGSGTNVIAQLSRLGASCGFVAQIGDDTVGAQIRQSLRDAMWVATVCAGCTCGKMGARSGPTLAQVEALL